MSEPVRMVYRQIRRGLSVDPEIMATIDESANLPNLTAGAIVLDVQESRLVALQKQAEELRIAFNRKNFIECNMSIFGIHELEEAVRWYETAKDLLEINPHKNELTRTTLMDIFFVLQEHVENKRFIPFLQLSIFLGKGGPNRDSFFHLCCS